MGQVEGSEQPALPARRRYHDPEKRLLYQKFSVSQHTNMNSHSSFLEGCAIFTVLEHLFPLFEGNSTMQETNGYDLRRGERGEGWKIKKEKLPLFSLSNPLKSPFSRNGREGISVMLFKVLNFFPSFFPSLPLKEFYTCNDFRTNCRQRSTRGK